MKKNIIIAIAIFIVGLIYGSFCNFFIVDNSSMVISIIQGFFVGMLSTTFYIIIVWISGFLFESVSKYLYTKKERIGIIFMNILWFELLWYGLTMFITNNGLGYRWIHIINLLFATLIFLQSYYDGKLLRNKQSMF